MMNGKEGLISKKNERMIKVMFNNYEVHEFKEGTSLKEIKGSMFHLFVCTQYKVSVT